MFCGNCGKQIREDILYCPHCNWIVDDNFSSIEKYYEIFGLSINASKAEVKEAYRSIMKDFHPDINQNRGTEFQKFINEKSKEYINAYEKIIEFIENKENIPKQNSDEHEKRADEREKTDRHYYKKQERDYCKRQEQKNQKTQQQRARWIKPIAFVIIIASILFLYSINNNSNNISNHSNILSIQSNSMFVDGVEFFAFRAGTLQRSHPGHEVTKFINHNSHRVTVRVSTYALQPGDRVVSTDARGSRIVTSDGVMRFNNFIVFQLEPNGGEDILLREFQTVRSYGIEIIR